MGAAAVRWLAPGGSLYGAGLHAATPAFQPGGFALAAAGGIVQRLRNGN
jgi:hypothetical protein